MEGTFHLRRQTGRWARYADVTVEVTPAAQHQVVITDQAFAWRLDSYGPDARFGGVYDADLSREAVEGAWYALGRLPGDTAPVRVVVTRVVDFPVDTGPGDVKFAAANAVWRAFDYEPAAPPWINEEGIPVFPADT